MTMMSSGGVVDLAHPDVRTMSNWATEQRWVKWHVGPAGKAPVVLAAARQEIDREFVIMVRGVGPREAAAWCCTDLVFEDGLRPQRTVWFYEGTAASITATVELAMPRQFRRNLANVTGDELPAAWAFPELRDGRWVAEMRTP